MAIVSYPRRRHPHLVGAVLTVLVVAACGGAGEDATPGPAAAAAPSGVPSAAAPAQPSASVAPAAPTPAQVSEPEDVVPSRIGSLLDPRGGWHTAMLLQDGRVLVAGGLAQHFAAYDVTDHLKFVELYAPTTGAWTLSGNMTLTRAGHTATLLDDGAVLVVGGVGASFVTPRSSTEVYDVSMDSWSKTGNMEAPRLWHAATLLEDGRVLVAGGLLVGRGFGPDASAAVYDPATGTWSSTGSMSAGRLSHTLTLLEDGSVLAVGGDGVVLAERYDSSESLWTEAGSLQQERRWHTATLLEDGRVLVTGGMTADLQALQSAEIYDPASGKWSLTGSMSEVRA